METGSERVLVAKTDSAPGEVPVPNFSQPRWAWAVLVCVLVFALWWRGHTIGPTVRQYTGLSLWPVVTGEAEPLDCDEAIYGYMGRRLVAGDVMYRDLTENKPPLGYWIFAAGTAIGGATETTIRLLPVPFVLGTIALVWWIALRLGGPIAGCVAAFLYALLSTDPYLYGNGNQFEQMINLFATAALALGMASGAVFRTRGSRSFSRKTLTPTLSRREQDADPLPAGEGGRRPGEGPVSRMSGWLIIAAGVCLGLGCLIKPFVAIDGLVLAIALLMTRRNERPLAHRVRDVVLLALGGLIVLALTAGVLAAQGASPDAIDDIFGYASALARDAPPEPGAPPFLVRWITGNADPSGHLPPPFGKTNYLVWWGTGSWPIWLAGLPAVAWLLRGPSGSGRRLVAFWLIASWIQVALPRLFWAHYYLLPTQALAIAVAVLLTDALRAARGSVVGSAVRTDSKPGWSAQRALRIAIGSSTALALLIAIAGFVVIQVRDYLLVPSEELTIRFKGGGQWIMLREIGRELARRTRDWHDPRLYIWGYQSPIAFYSGLDNVTRQVFADNFIRAFADKDHPQSRPRIERTLNDLRAHPPDLIFVGYPPFSGLRSFLLERYLPAPLTIHGQPLPAFPNGMGLWVEKSRYDGFVSSTTTNTK